MAQEARRATASGVRVLFPVTDFHRHYLQLLCLGLCYAMALMYLLAFTGAVVRGCRKREGEGGYGSRGNFNFIPKPEPESSSLVSSLRRDSWRLLVLFPISIYRRRRWKPYLLCAKLTQTVPTNGCPKEWGEVTRTRMG